MRWGKRAVAAVLTVALGALPACASPEGGAPGRTGQPGADQPAGPLRIVTAGDSITAGGPPWDLQETSYPEVVQQVCGAHCRVRDVSNAGACLLLEGCFHPTRLRQTLDEQVWSRAPGASGGPDVAVVMIGANDLGGYNETATFVRELRSIRRDGHDAGVRVVFATITPARNFWPQRCEDQRRELNAWILEQPGSIDLAAVLESSTGELRARYDSGDGLHPNARAYRAMGRAVWASLGS